MEENNKVHGQKEFKIIVNGRENVVEKEVLTFDEVVKLADVKGGSDVLYTVTYRKAAGKKEDGILVEGETVEVKDGTIFNVTATSKS